MPPLRGKLLRIYVGDDAAGPWTLVKHMNSYEKSSDSPAESTATFDDEVDLSTPSGREQSFSISGVLSSDDPGQVAVREAEAAKTPTYLRVLPDGVNGFIQPVLVGSFSHRASPSGFQEYGWDCTATGAGVATTGGGYVI